MMVVGCPEKTIISYLRRVLSGDTSVIQEAFCEGARPAWFQNGLLLTSDIPDFAANIRNTFGWGREGVYEGSIRTKCIQRNDQTAVVFAQFEDPAGGEIEVIYVLGRCDADWMIITSVGRAPATACAETLRTTERAGAY